MKRLLVCRKCRRFVEGKICNYCKSTDLSASWKGMISVLDCESEMAKKLGIKEPGRYALFVE